jgi:hypothetical protein
MERAARMAERAPDEPAGQREEQRGMRLVVDFISGKTASLLEVLAGEEPAGQMAVRHGMAKALLRNIVLPREEHLMEGSGKAIAGLIELSGQDNEVASVGEELQQILGQYDEHKKQIRQQLEEGMRAQLAQQMQQQGIETEQLGSIDPTLHPEFQKQWSSAQADLNDQYTQALDQRKEILMQRFA